MWKIKDDCLSQWLLPLHGGYRQPTEPGPPSQKKVISTPIILQNRCLVQVWTSPRKIAKKRFGLHFCFLDLPTRSTRTARTWWSSGSWPSRGEGWLSRGVGWAGGLAKEVGLAEHWAGWAGSWLSTGDRLNRRVGWIGGTVSLGGGWQRQVLDGCIHECWFLVCLFCLDGPESVKPRPSSTKHLLHVWVISRILFPQNMDTIVTVNRSKPWSFNLKTSITAANTQNHTVTFQKRTCSSLKAMVFQMWSKSSGWSELCCSPERQSYLCVQTPACPLTLICRRNTHARTQQTENLFHACTHLISYPCAISLQALFPDPFASLHSSLDPFPASQSWLSFVYMELKPQWHEGKVYSVR